MNRRDFLKNGGLAALATSILPRPWRHLLAAGRRSMPNIILIMADDLGYGDLGIYGQEKIRTPRLDAMALDGARFTDFYSGAPICATSRATLLTGLHSGHVRIRGNYPLVPLANQDTTLGKILNGLGYRTGIIGKWGVGEFGSTGVPNHQGFDYFFGYLNQRNAHSYYPEFVWKNDQKIFLNQGNDNQIYSHDLFTEEALAFIQRNKGQPYFLYLAYTIPHAELAVPEDSLRPYLGKFPETPWTGNHFSHQETPRAAFAGMVSRMDRDVGQILDLLDELGLTENTLVIFTSDNGPTYAGGADPEFFNSNGGLRGAKRDLYEGGIRVPLIARWPGEVPKGTISNHPCAMWDLLPTIVEVAGGNPPQKIDGISFVPALLGNPTQQKQHRFLYWEYHDSLSSQAVRMATWKGLRHAPNDPLELYDLSKDIAEKHNIAEQKPEIVEKIELYMSRGRTESSSWPLRERTMWRDLRAWAKKIFEKWDEPLDF